MKPRLLTGALFVFTLGAADGGSVFKTHCTGCHGNDAKGVAAVGTPDFTNPKTLSGLSDADVIGTISNGRQGTIMPAWKGKLSDEEITGLVTYLRSLGRK